MKKLLLLFVCISFGLSESWAQYNHTETAIPESEVPELIKKIHQEKYPGAFVTSWQVKTDKAATTPNPIYVVNFKLDGRQGHKSFYTDSILTLILEHTQNVTLSIKGESEEITLNQFQNFLDPVKIRITADPPAYSVTQYTKKK